MKPHIPVLLCLSALACSHDKRPDSAYDSQAARQSSPQAGQIPAAGREEPLTPASGLGQARPTAGDAEIVSEPGAEAVEATGNNAGINQGDSEADMAIALRVRESLLQDPSLSFIAKSITIVVRDGRVMLRGLVNNPRERAAVERLVRAGDAVRQVDNQLGVATE